MRTTILKRMLQQSGPYVLIAPAASIIVLVLIYPTVAGFHLSFYSWTLGLPWQAKTFVGFDNFMAVFKNEAFWSTLRVTLVFVFAVVTIESAIGLAIALLLEGKMRGLRIFRAIFFLPLMIAPVAVGVIWRFFYDPYFGLFNYFLSVAGMAPRTWLASHSLALPAVIVADIWQWTPFMFILILAGLQSLPSDPIEAAVIDGASYFQVLMQVKLPLLKSVLAVALVLRLIDALKALEVIFNMTFGGPGRSTTVWALQIYKTAFLSQRLGQASVYAGMLCLIQLLLSMTLLFFIRPTSARR